MAILSPEKWRLDLDERTKDWFLVDPLQMLVVAVAYVVFIVGGKAIMKDRKPLDLWSFRVFHNAILTAASLYLTVEIARQAAATSWYGPIVRGERGLGMATALYYFYLSKILEFNDTLIMVLRKKFDQVSFLHVYHHVTVLLVWWFNISYYPGGEAYPSAWLNSFVHVWMYGYYLISTLGYDVWWKKYLTQLQISQLSLFVLQGFLIIWKSAEEYQYIGIINSGYAATLVVLFMNFYRQSYKNRRPQKKD